MLSQLHYRNGPPTRVKCINPDPDSKCSMMVLTLKLSDWILASYEHIEICSLRASKKKSHGNIELWQNSYSWGRAVNCGNIEPWEQTCVEHRAMGTELWGTQSHGNRAAGNTELWGT